MTIEEALYKTLTSTIGLSSLIEARVYPVLMPQNCQLPAITYQRISGSRVYAFQKDTDLAHPVFQINCWAKTYSEVKSIARQVRLALQNFSGLMGGTDGVNVSAVIILGDMDDYEPETGIYSIKMDFEIWHEEDQL